MLGIEFRRAVENGLVRATYSEVPAEGGSPEPVLEPMSKHEIDMSFGAIKRFFAEHFPR